LSSFPPQNSSSTLLSVQGTITPAEMFFIRDHYEEPLLSLSKWRLRIEGNVSIPLELSFSDFLESSTTKLQSTLECAGNSPSGFAVSTGIWEGVPMRQFLQKAGVLKASYVMLEGADVGRLRAGSIRAPFARIVPLRKCLSPETLLAFKLNDRFLSRSGGFPVRAILPGWYGMDSVKWLQRIVVVEADTNPKYTNGMEQVYVRRIRETDGQILVHPVSEMSVKSEIAFPSDGAILPSGVHSVWGFAWAGQNIVKRVQLSTDGGKNWSAAELKSSSMPFAWVKWQYLWTAQPGDHILISRAENLAGDMQPLIRDARRKDGYELNECAPTRCLVR
jgi:DMSO/TMAO reductase YedYZ molybdopterin-dependent catalytic subunit